MTETVRSFGHPSGLPVPGGHCWHSMGLASGDRSGGSDTFECCWCGTTRVVLCNTHYTEKEGHGHHHQEGRLTWGWPKEQCPYQGVR